MKRVVRVKGLCKRVSGFPPNGRQREYGRPLGGVNTDRIDRAVNALTAWISSSHQFSSSHIDDVFHAPRQFHLLYIEMVSRSPSPEFSPLAIGEDLTPLPAYKAASTTLVNFANLLEPPLRLHEDLKSGCGGQLWPAGMVLAQHMLRYHKHSLKDARMSVTIFSDVLSLTNRCVFSIRLELGAGGGLVGLGIAIGCGVERPIYVTDQENMFSLMSQNITLNELGSRVVPLILNW